MCCYKEANNQHASSSGTFLALRSFTRYVIHPLHHSPVTSFTRYIIHLLRHSSVTSFIRYIIHPLRNSSSKKKGYLGLLRYCLVHAEGYATEERYMRSREKGREFLKNGKIWNNPTPSTSTYFITSGHKNGGFRHPSLLHTLGCLIYVPR